MAIRTAATTWTGVIDLAAPVWSGLINSWLVWGGVHSNLQILDVISQTTLGQFQMGVNVCATTKTVPMDLQYEDRGVARDKNLLPIFYQAMVK